MTNPRSITRKALSICLSHHIDCDCHGCTDIYERISQSRVDLALCEQEHLILRPDILYRFIVHPNCERCNELATIGAPQ